MATDASDVTSSDGLRKALVARYRTGQASLASGAIYADVRAAWPHYRANYGDLVDRIRRDAVILDVGTGHGSLIAWLRSCGFTAVTGVDASPGDVAFANEHLGAGVVTHADFIEHLESHASGFDAVFVKAVLEHMPKDLLLRALDALARSLRPGGTLIVEVPNMDWLLAGHERYMDLTHEVGFTPQSLHALLALRFAEVEIRGSHLAAMTRSQRLFRPLLVRVLRRALYVLGEGASDTLFAHRSLIATARRGR